MMGSDLNSEEPGSCVAPNGWEHVALTGRVSSRSGDGKIIKGKQAEGPGGGLVQGFSASGPDVWVADAHYESDGVAVSAVGARCGKTFLARAPWTAIANTHALVPGDSIDVRFLWYLTNREDWWIKSGTAQPFVKVKDTLARRELIPPLAEQQRIVEILEEQLSRLDAALESVRIVREKVAQFRRSLLHAAFSGELACAAEPAPREWPVVELQALAADERHSLAIGPFGSNLKVSDYRDSGVPLVFVRNIRSHDFELTPTYVDDQKARDLAAHSCTSGDVLVTKMGDPPGDVAIYPDNRPSAVITADCIKVTPNQQLISSEFMALAIESPECAEQIREMSGGVAQQKVNLAKFRRLQVVVPPLTTQERITKVLGELSEQVEHALVAADRIERKTTALRRSLLHAAFTGKLTEQWREEHAHV